MTMLCLQEVYFLRLILRLEAAIMMNRQFPNVHREGAMIKRLVLSSAMSAIIATALPFDSRDARVNAQYLVSTKAGFVSRVRGEVFVERARTEERERVSPSLQMMDGDRLSTSAASRVEILIHSQAYLRLDEYAEVRAINTVMAEARFELLRGTAMIEVGRMNKMDKGIVFEIVTPQGIVTFSKEGLYRIHIEPSSTRLDVIEGEITLGERQDALSKTASKIGDGKRVELKSDAPTAPIITALERKPFDEFDRWSFQVAKYGEVRRLEAGVFTTCRDQEQSEQCRVSPEFQLREDEWLITNTDGYAELRLNRGASASSNSSRMPSRPTRGIPGANNRGISFDPNRILAPWLSRGTYLCLNQQTQLHAIKTENDDSVFELRSGSIIVVTDRYAKMRPLKIITPDGAFAIERGCIVRFDVNPPQTLVSVRMGEVRMETRGGEHAKSALDIGHGKRLRLAGSASPHIEGFNANIKAKSIDAFDRWGFRLATAGYLTRYEGKVSIERQSGTKLELGKDKDGPRMQVQLWEGDRLMTAPGGRAEILLSSKAVLHVNEESEVRVVSTELLTPHFELLRGAAYVHHLSSMQTAYQSLWPSDAVSKKAKIEISTPHGIASISSSGSYRFDADDSSTTIKVHEGSLLLGAHEEVMAKAALKVKEKETAHLTSSDARGPEIAKLAPSPPDDFDKWSTLFLRSLATYTFRPIFSTPDTAGPRAPSGPSGPIRF